MVVGDITGGTQIESNAASVNSFIFRHDTKLKSHLQIIFSCS